MPSLRYGTKRYLLSPVLVLPDICDSSVCGPGSVNYASANSGQFRINSGLPLAEGDSPFGNSNHPGGLNISFADGSVKFVSESIGGAVYAALFSPSSAILDQTALQQIIPSGDTF